MNTGAPVTIAGFSFTITTTDTDITFTGTDASTTTATYIFPPSDSFDFLNGFPVNTLSPGQTMDGTDLSNSGTGTVLGTGATLGLGRVLFDVLPGAVTGPFEVDFVANGTNLNDPAFQGITIDTLTPGQINVSTPEPATVALFGAALLGVVGLRKRAIARR